MVWPSVTQPMSKSLSTRPEEEVWQVGLRSYPPSAMMCMCIPSFGSLDPRFVLRSIFGIFNFICMQEGMNEKE